MEVKEADPQDVLRERSAIELPATPEGCQREMDKLMEESTRIELQLNNEKARGGLGRTEERKLWMARATAALRYKRRRYQILMRHLGELKRKERQKGSCDHQALLIFELRQIVGDAAFIAAVQRVKGRFSLDN